MEWKMDGSRPIWIQLYEQLTRRIVSGQYPVGTRVPSVRELAAEAGVNPNTMQRAMAYLEERGLVVGNRTQGRVVTEDRDKIHAVRLELAEDLKKHYLEGMAVLGFTGAEAVALLEEGE